MRYYESGKVLTPNELDNSGITSNPIVCRVMQNTSVIINQKVREKVRFVVVLSKFAPLQDFPITI